MKPIFKLLLLGAVALGSGACSPLLSGRQQTPATGPVIYQPAEGRKLGFEQLMNRLAPAQVIYAGEKHSQTSHHRIQLQLLKALSDLDPQLTVAMEMFARPYQPVLDLWSAGKLTWNQLLRKTHWYANWRFDAALYRPLLEETRRRKLKLVALNIAFHIPAKIAVGGIENLAADEKAQLPAAIDYGYREHQAYIKKIYDSHKLKGRDRFEDFYAAQCVWEEIMAQSIAENLSAHKMLVIIGNGHIYRKFGVPVRAFKRTGASYATIYPSAKPDDLEQDAADFIWLTGDGS